ncbi:MAG: hypothetical protein ACOCUF_03380 [Patescibacteria group bacterium]
MRKIKKYGLSLFFISASLFTHLPVKADWREGIESAGDFGLPENTPSGILENIIGWLLFITSFLAVLAIIVSGLMILLSGGNKDMADKGKKGVQYSIIGLAVILLAYVIIKVVDSLLTSTSLIW